MKHRNATGNIEPWSADAMIGIAREVMKLAVIFIYTVFATITLISTHNPLAFAPLLSWALWSGWRTRDITSKQEIARDETERREDGSTP